MLSDDVAPQRKPCVSPGPVAGQMQDVGVAVGPGGRNVDDLLAPCSLARGGVAADPPVLRGAQQVAERWGGG